MTKTKKTWREKLLAANDLPKVVLLDSRTTKTLGKGRMVIAAPKEVDAIMRRVPEGKLITIDLVRKKLAKQHRTDTACPLTTGIFAWIAANAAEEARAQGAPTPTPWWRTLKAGGELNPKYPGGIAAQTARLVNEGHEVAARGKRWFVVDYEDRLVRVQD